MMNYKLQMAMNKKCILFFLIIIFCIISVQGQTKAFRRKNALKTTFLSFYTGSAKLTYERSVMNGQSFEITAGIIGAGYDAYHNHPVGGLCRLAYKFIFFATPDYPLNGFYVKPELAFSYFGYNARDDNSRRLSSNVGTLMGCVGYQWAKRIFIAEGFVGAGLGIGHAADTRYQHGFISRLQCVTLTFGLKIGFVFGKKQEEVTHHE